MISAKAKKLFTRIIRVGHRAGFSIIGQEHGSNKLVCSDSKIYQAWVYIQMGMTLLYQAFLCYQVGHIAANPESLMKQKIRILSVTLASIILNCNHAVGLFRAHEYVWFVNGYRQLMQNHIDSDQPCRRSIRFMKIVSFISFFVTFTNIIAVIRNPTSPHVLTSLAANPMQLPFFPYKLAAGIFQVVSNGFHMYAFCLQNSTVFSYAHDVTAALGKLKPPAFHMPAHARHMKAVEFAKLHRAFGILQAHFGALYANWITFTLTAAQMVVILNVYLAVMARRERSLVLAMAISVGCWIFLEQIAEVHQMSTVVVRQWRTVPRAHLPRWFPKLMKSCRHVYVPVGRFFYADKGLVLTVCSIIIDTSASLILANE